MNNGDSVTTGDNGREAKGRFAPGNTFGKGSPVAKRMHANRCIMLSAVDRPSLEAATRKLVGLAIAGDVQAIKLLFEYIIGKPTQAIELAGPGGEPLGSDVARWRRALTQAIEAHPQARPAIVSALKAVDEADDAGG